MTRFWQAGRRARTRPGIARRWRLAAATCGCLAILATPAEAGLFTKIFREASEAAGKVDAPNAKLADLDLPNGLDTLITRLPKVDRDRALIAKPTPEGHMRVFNASGETVTASTPDEISAALQWLLPNASATARQNVDFYLPPTALQGDRTALNILPTSARVHVVNKSRRYRVLGSPPFGDAPLRVRLKNELVLKADGPDALAEAVWQLRRPMKPAELRVLSLDPDGPAALPRLRAAVSTDATAATPESANPFALAKDLSSLRGQTVVLSGKVENDLLFFTPPSGKTQSVLLSDLRTTAFRDDVNLIVLEADGTRQPGVRNLLWQRTQVDGLDDALKSASLGDFWQALGRNRGPLELTVTPRGTTHVAMRVTPNPSLAGQLPDDDGSLLTYSEKLLTEFVATASGEVVTQSITATMRSEAQETELSQRIVPGIPSTIQLLYIVALIAGLMGLPTITRWWRRLWPLKAHADFESTLGLIGNRLARAIPFALVFLPLAAPLATPYQMLMRPFELITLPFRMLFRLVRPA